MKIAIIFSGQGAQTPGMGRSIYESSAAAKEWFDRAGDHIKHLCFDADEQTLGQTLNTQPAVYAMSMAAYAALKERLDKMDIAPAMFAGHSLGEYSALTTAGHIPASAGAALIQRRAGLMSEAAAGGMCAVIADAATTLRLCSQAAEHGMILPVNYNAPKQTVVAGEQKALEAFIALAAERGVRAVPLKVSGAFHSPMMESAYQGLKEYLKEVPAGTPMAPVYCNVDGKPYNNGIPQSDIPENIRALLALQVKSPVRWVDTIQNMAADGADIFIEVGVGRVQSGLIRKINRELKVLSVTDGPSLDETVNILKQEMQNA